MVAWLVSIQDNYSVDGPCNFVLTLVYPYRFSSIVIAAAGFMAQELVDGKGIVEHWTSM